LGPAITSGTAVRCLSEPPPAALTEVRLANFIVKPQNFPSLVPSGVDMSVEDYFNKAVAEIERNPSRYAAFQKF
jgi:hypothetical protein